MLYTSSYPPSLVWIWRCVNVASMVIMLCAGPAYYIFCILLFTRRKIVDHEHNIADEAADLIEDNKSVSMCSRICRVCVSYGIALVIMFLNLILVVGLTVAQNYAVLTQAIIKPLQDKTNIPLLNHWVILAFSVVVSIITAVTNSIWKLIASKLTNFERHRTWSSYRNHESFKLIFFSLMNLSVIGFAKGFFTNPCVLEVLGNQYLIQFIIELLIFNTIELAFPYIKYVIQKCCHKGNYDEIRPEFNIADEYLELSM